MSANESFCSILAFGAHPDDIEFGCGGVIALETANGNSAHFVVTSLGEAGTSGTPAQREQESRRAAELLQASIEFIDLGGDCHLELNVQNAFSLAALVRRFRPRTVLAPTCGENQHPDHSKLGKLVRDACRYARYGGLQELDDLPTHQIEQLFYYAVTTEGGACGASSILIDISAPHIVSQWTEAMQAHETQTKSRNYIDLQLTRARLAGIQAGVEYAIQLFPNDTLVFESLTHAGKGARRF